MNVLLPPDIEAFLIDAALEFRAAMTDQAREQYEREQIADAQAMRPDDESTKDMG